jgi:hypothetical protein
MVNYAVESTLDKRGFLRRVGEGERRGMGSSEPEKLTPHRPSWGTRLWFSHPDYKTKA